MSPEIPKEWSSRPLGELVEFQKGRLVPIIETPVEGSKPYIGVDSFLGHYKTFTSSLRGIECNADDVLMLWDGERSGLCATGLIGVVGSTVARLRPHKDINPRFLFHYLDKAFDFIQGQRTGTGIPHVPKDLGSILSLQFPNSESEQRCIAEILDTVDETIQKTEALIAKLKAMKAGLLHDLLTMGLDEHGQLRDPVAHPEQFKDSPLGRISRDWELRQINDIATYQNGKAFPSSDYTDSGIPLLRPGNLPHEDLVRWDKDHTTHLPLKWSVLAHEYIVLDDELVMNLTAQSLEDQFLGRVCMTPPGTHCLLNQRLARFKSKDCHLHFLFWTLKGPYFREQIDRLPQGTKVQHIYNENLDAIILPMPTQQSEQRAIAEALFAHSARIRAEEAYLEKLKLQKKGLMHDLLTGKVRTVKLTTQDDGR